MRKGKKYAQTKFSCTTKKTLKLPRGGEENSASSKGNAWELKKFAETLVSTVVTLRKHSQWSEFEPGLLFTVVPGKDSEIYVVQISRAESIETL